MEHDLGLQPKSNQNYFEDIQKMFQYSIEKISCYEKLYWIEFKGTMRMA